MKAGRSPAARVAESGEGCVEARKNLFALVPVALRAASTISMA